MDFRDKQIAPPKDWGRFEDLCHSLFKAVWDDPLAQKHGRRGQAQQGVDIYGRPGRTPGELHGLQCKGKDANYGSAATASELLAEIGKAESFSPTLAHWILATTASVDGSLQRLARELSADRRERGRFTVDVLGWQELQALLAEHPDVAREFYPEHMFDVSGLLRDLTAFAKQPHAEPPAEKWVPLTFDSRRNLGPALMGRPLGPADAVSCPRLFEADVLVQHLKTAFSARLFGEPGAGKSVCSMQAALTLASNGVRVLRLVNPQARVLRLPPADTPTLFLIDDAHLMPAGALSLLEQHAGPQTFVLSTLNAVEPQTIPSGAVVIDAARAVRTIADALRVDRMTTLAAVHAADDRVGEHAGDVRLEQRLEEAEQSPRPWQFCFVLGGGWRRAKEAADRARHAGADIVLAAIAMRQLGSRDARATPPEIIEMCAREGIPSENAVRSIGWLARQRLILSPEDCRTPHQRFSGVVLHHLLIGQDADGKEKVFRFAQRMLCDSSYPLPGLRNFLDSFRFGPGDYRWWHAFPVPVLQVLADRCWSAIEDEDRLYASLVLAEIEPFCDSWIEQFIRPNSATLSRWMSCPGGAGYGLGRLLNDTMNKDRALATEIVGAISPALLATAFSHSTQETAFGRSELVERIHVASPEWAEAFRANLDSDRLLALAKEWTTAPSAYLYVHLLEALILLHEDLALEMAEAFAPVVSRILRDHPFDGFRELDGLFGRVLRVFDVLGVYVGKRAPKPRQWSIARAICREIDSETTAFQLARLTKRDMQAASFFLSFLNTCAPRKAGSVAAKLDWDALAAVIGDDWADLPHDAEVLIGVLSGLSGTRDMVRKFVTANAGRIVWLPPRIALVAPPVAIEHIARGKSIALIRHGHVDWTFGPLLIALLAEERPDLLEPFVLKHAAGIAMRLAGPNASFFNNSAPFINQLRLHTGSALAAILRRVDPTAAEPGWVDSLSKPGGARQAVAILVEEALRAEGDIRALAQRLRRRFPSASQLNGTTGLVPRNRRRRALRRDRAH